MPEGRRARLRAEVLQGAAGVARDPPAGPRHRPLPAAGYQALAHPPDGAHPGTTGHWQDVGRAEDYPGRPGQHAERAARSHPRGLLHQPRPGPVPRGHLPLLRAHHPHRLPVEERDHEEPQPEGARLRVPAVQGVLPGAQGPQREAGRAARAAQGAAGEGQRPYRVLGRRARTHDGERVQEVLPGLPGLFRCQPENRPGRPC
mmetsp:Transcript_43549/g.113295  ORF Transcript_43549/g.113295 Transcript_43549/m.113295 type:complete len:202 (-) Transcript_43549:1901-2506(-)